MVIATKFEVKVHADCGTSGSKDTTESYPAPEGYFINELPYGPENEYGYQLIQTNYYGKNGRSNISFTDSIPQGPGKPPLHRTVNVSAHVEGKGRDIVGSSKGGGAIDYTFIGYAIKDE